MIPPRLRELASALTRGGARLEVILPDGETLPIGAPPARARVRFHDDAALAPLLRGDHLGLAEAYLAARVDIEGDPYDVVKVTDVLDLEPGRLARLGWLARLWLPGRTARNAAAIAFHYDRPAEFFLPWFERWRSYSHGFYATPDDDPAAAQARKMQYAIDRLGLRAGMRVLDMGGGWGSFVEYAGRQGIRVEAITISREQHAFVEALIARERLPCTVTLVDFLAYRPAAPLDAAVFMGTLEHVPDVERVAAFLARHLTPGGRVYADFCAQQSRFQVGAFLQKYLWPGPVAYVDLARLVRALTRAGLTLHEIGDDTLSYAYTVRDWARGLEAHRAALAERFGEPAVRAFLLFFWASYHFLTTNRTQAYHLVAGRTPRGVDGGTV
jgi:cyclopropane-fatty-acyl-phospholipid synthase